MKKPIQVQPEPNFFQRRVQHVQRHWWSYGIGAAVACALAAWLTTFLCDELKMTWQKAEQHYRQSDINTIRINDLEIAVSNLQVRQRNLWLTNRLLDDEIRALQWKLGGVKSR